MAVSSQASVVFTARIESKSRLWCSPDCRGNPRERTLFFEDFDPEEMQVELCKTICSGLESLTLSAIYSRDVELDSLKTHCANLRRIFIDQMGGRNEEVSGLLASYRNQLEYCSVEE